MSSPDGSETPPPFPYWILEWGWQREASFLPRAVLLNTELFSGKCWAFFGAGYKKYTAEQVIVSVCLGMQPLITQRFFQYFSFTNSLSKHHFIALLGVSLLHDWIRKEEILRGIRQQSIPNKLSYNLKEESLTRQCGFTHWSLPLFWIGFMHSF